MVPYFERVTKGNALRMHELAVQWPAAAAACVHWAFDSTIQALFRCAPAASWKRNQPHRQHLDMIPALSGMPGIATYVRVYVKNIHSDINYGDGVEGKCVCGGEGATGRGGPAARCDKTS